MGLLVSVNSFVIYHINLLTNDQRHYKGIIKAYLDQEIATVGEQ